MATPFETEFVRLLRAFDKSELKTFESWLRAPWCNSNKNLIGLVDRLKRYHPGFDDPKLTKEKLFRQVLPAGKFTKTPFQVVLFPTV